MFVWLFLTLWLGCALPSAPPKVEAGVLDARPALSQQGDLVPLSGDWELWWGVLLLPEDLDHTPPTGVLRVPGSWEGAPALPGGLPARGAATLRVRLTLPDDGYGLYSDAINSAHRLWVNGTEIQSSGFPALDPEQEVPDVRPLVRALEGDEVELVLQISNERHRVGGLRRAPIVGRMEDVVRYAQRGLLRDTWVSCTLAVSGLYFFILYQLRTRHKATLYFALFCLDAALRSSVAGGPQILRAVFPDLPWMFVIRLEYVTTFLLMGLGAQMMASLFPQEAPWRLIRLAAATSLVLGLLVMATPIEVYTRALLPFQLVGLLTLGVVIVLVGRALLHRRPMAQATAIGSAIFIGGTVFDILYSHDIIHGATQMGAPTLFVFLLTQAFSHAREFSRSYDTIEHLSGELMVANEDLGATNRAVERFVPYAFLDLLNKRSIREVERGDHTRRDMGVVFCDLRAFTTVVEGLSPEAAFRFINQYLRVMEPAIHANGGFINQYLGDCIMALYPGEPEAGLRGSVAMLTALRAWNRERRAAGEAEVRVGVGFSAGPLMLGTIGGLDRLDNGVIGDTVNRSARLEGLTKRYDTVMITDDNLVSRLKDPVGLRPLDRVIPKGKSEPIRLYEVLDALDPDEAAARGGNARDFAAGIAAWERQDREGAVAAFDACLEAHPGDGPARQMRARCAGELPPGGVTRLQDK